MSPEMAKPYSNEILRKSLLASFIQVLYDLPHFSYFKCYKYIKNPKLRVRYSYPVIFHHSSLSANTIKSKIIFLCMYRMSKLSFLFVRMQNGMWRPFLQEHAGGCFQCLETSKGDKPCSFSANVFTCGLIGPLVQKIKNKYYQSRKKKL